MEEEEEGGGREGEEGGGGEGGGGEGEEEGGGEGGWRRKSSVHSSTFLPNPCTSPLLGNKGAVGISFYFGSLSLCFVSSHLTSGSEKCHRSV